MKSIDVFVSFRGIDTRRTFVSHLLLSLFKKDFTTFEQEEETPPNQPASSQVLNAIEDSRIAIVVISKNYTASVSCLDELSKIVELAEKQSSLVMIPVLYEVGPEDVLGQAEKDLEEHNNLEKVKPWRDSLAKSIQIYLDNYSYWEEEDSYSYIIDIVMIHVSDSMRPPPKASPLDYPNLERYRFILLIPIGLVTIGIGLVRVALWMMAERYVDQGKHVSTKPRPVRSSVYLHEDKYVTGNELCQDPFTDYNRLVGMDRRMKAVEALLLDLDSQVDRVGEIGIWGVEGVGKTTLARCVYQQMSPQFQDHYYFVCGGSGSGGGNVSAGLYSTCLLEKITKAALRIPPLSESFYEHVKAKLGHRKILLIVDGVDGLDRIRQLQNIRKIARWFGPGSRLIFVSQCKSLLPDVKRLCEVESLRYDEALQLFSQFAFKQEHVPRGYYRFSVRAVLITGRNPLAIKVFGSFLRRKSISEWESELCRLEASQDNSVATVSSYIGNAFS